MEEGRVEEGVVAVGVEVGEEEVLLWAGSCTTVPAGKQSAHPY